MIYTFESHVEILVALMLEKNLEMLEIVCQFSHLYKE